MYKLDVPLDIVKMFTWHKTQPNEVVTHFSLSILL